MRPALANHDPVTATESRAGVVYPSGEPGTTAKPFLPLEHRKIEPLDPGGRPG